MNSGANSASWVIFCILGVLIWHECIKAKNDWFMKAISVSAQKHQQFMWGCQLFPKKLILSHPNREVNFSEKKFFLIPVQVYLKGTYPVIFTQGVQCLKIRIFQRAHGLDSQQLGQ